MALSLRVFLVLLIQCLSFRGILAAVISRTPLESPSQLTDNGTQAWRSLSIDPNGNSTSNTNNQNGTISFWISGDGTQKGPLDKE